MFGQASAPEKKPPLPFHVETDQVVAAWRSTRFLWTGLGFAVLMLLGVIAWSPHPLAPHASAASAHLVPEVAFVSMTALDPRGMHPARHPGSAHSHPSSFRPAVLTGSHPAALDLWPGGKDQTSTRYRTVYAGRSAEQMKAQGFSNRFLRKNGFNMSEIEPVDPRGWKSYIPKWPFVDSSSPGKRATSAAYYGYSIEQMKRAGFNDKWLKKNGFYDKPSPTKSPNKRGLADAYYGYNVKQMKSFGFSDKYLKKHGFDLSDESSTGPAGKTAAWWKSYLPSAWFGSSPVDDTAKSKSELSSDDSVDPTYLPDRAYVPKRTAAWTAAWLGQIAAEKAAADKEVAERPVADKVYYNSYEASVSKQATAAAAEQASFAAEQAAAEKYVADNAGAEAAALWRAEQLKPHGSYEPRQRPAASQDDSFTSTASAPASKWQPYGGYEPKNRPGSSSYVPKNRPAASQDGAFTSVGKAPAPAWKPYGGYDPKNRPAAP